jgi:hypothetical protein
LVLNFVDGVGSGFRLSSVAGLLNDSDLVIEDGVVSGLSLLSVKNLVLVGEAGLSLINVRGDGVGSLEDLNLVSVSVLLFFSVENFIMSFVSGVWDISPFCFGVVTIDDMGLEGEASIHVWSVLDLVGLGVSNFFFSLISGLNGIARGGYWNLSGSDFSLGLGLNVICNLFVKNFDISCILLCAMFDVGVFDNIVVGSD